MITKKTRLILCLVITVCAVQQVVILNRHSTSGEQLSQIMAEVEVIKKSNETLQQHIASESALTTIAARSAALRLDRHVQTLSLAQVPPIALAKNTSL